MLHVCRHNGTLYLEEPEKLDAIRMTRGDGGGPPAASTQPTTNNSSSDDINTPAAQKLYTADDEQLRRWRYWGYRFETLSTVPASPRERRDGGPDYVRQLLVERTQRQVNTNEQYCVVARTRINRTSVIMGAEGTRTSNKSCGA